MRVRTNVWFMCVLAGVLFATGGRAHSNNKGSDIEFHGTVTKVEQTTTASGNVFVQVVGFEIPVKVTGDTDIVEHGDKVGLAGIKVNDFVKVEGFFGSSGGIMADEIQILDDADAVFRLRGRITAVSSSAAGTTITVLGVAVLVNSETNIEPRGPKGGFTIADLKVGMHVDAMGSEMNGALVATRVKVGHRGEDAVRIEFDGRIKSKSNGRLEVDIEGGGMAVVLLTDSTVVKGTLAVGKSVKVKGTLNSNLEVAANRIVVEGDEEHGDDEGEDEFHKEVALTPAFAGITMKGTAALEYDIDDGRIEQELEVEIEHAEPGKQFRIIVFFGTSGTMDFGALFANPEGRAQARYSSNPSRGALDLTSLLPAGKDVRDITKIQITDMSLSALLEGSF